MTPRYRRNHTEVAQILREAVSELDGAGGRAMCYAIHRIWDPGDQSYNERIRAVQWIKALYRQDSPDRNALFWYAPPGKELDARATALLFAAELWDDPDFSLEEAR